MSCLNNNSVLLTLLIRLRGRFIKKSEHNCANVEKIYVFHFKHKQFKSVISVASGDEYDRGRTLNENIFHFLDGYKEKIESKTLETF